MRVSVLSWFNRVVGWDEIRKWINTLDWERYDEGEPVEYVTDMKVTLFTDKESYLLMMFKDLDQEPDPYGWWGVVMESEDRGLNWNLIDDVMDRVNRHLGRAREILVNHEGITEEALIRFDDYVSWINTLTTRLRVIDKFGLKKSNALRYLLSWVRSATVLEERMRNALPDSFPSDNEERDFYMELVNVWSILMNGLERIIPCW